MNRLAWAAVLCAAVAVGAAGVATAGAASVVAQAAHQPTVSTTPAQQTPAACAGLDAVDYSWDGTAGSTGTVTVHGDLPLCEPITLGVAAWSYDAAGSLWPQTLREYRTYVVRSGTTTFVTPTATCGVQRDVYASTNANDISRLVAGRSTLTQAGIPFEPAFLSSLVRGGPQQPSYSADDPAQPCPAPAAASVQLPTLVAPAASVQAPTEPAALAAATTARPHDLQASDDELAYSGGPQTAATVAAVVAGAAFVVGALLLATGARRRRFRG